MSYGCPWQDLAGTMTPCQEKLACPCSGTCHNSPMKRLFCDPNRSSGHQLMVSNPASTMAYASPTLQWEQVVPCGHSQCAEVQQAQCASRQRKSIANVDWVSSLLLYGQLTWQVKINLKKINKVQGFFLLYTAGIPLATCPSNTFNKQQEGEGAVKPFSCSYAVLLIPVAASSQPRSHRVV